MTNRDRDLSIQASRDERGRFQFRCETCRDLPRDRHRFKAHLTHDHDWFEIRADDALLDLVYKLGLGEGAAMVLRGEALP